MTRRIEDLGGSLRPGISLAVRVGIHTGLVVVGPLGGVDHREPIAHGDATNFAARLQEHADPGSVVVSKATFSYPKRSPVH